MVAYGWPLEPTRRFDSGVDGSAGRPAPSRTNSDPRAARAGPKYFGDGLSKIVTWLILPVVICLSQRLSHACLSISNYTVKLRMAH